MNLQKYNKAYVPVGVAVILFLLSQFGITEHMTVQDVVQAVVASLVVYAVPNKG